jgi:hypothetical protein
MMRRGFDCSWGAASAKSRRMKRSATQCQRKSEVERLEAMKHRRGRRRACKLGVLMSRQLRQGTKGRETSKREQADTDHAVGTNRGHLQSKRDPSSGGRFRIALEEFGTEPISADQPINLFEIIDSIGVAESFGESLQ